MSFYKTSISKARITNNNKKVYRDFQNDNILNCSNVYMCNYNLYISIDQNLSVNYYDLTNEFILKYGILKYYTSNDEVIIKKKIIFQRCRTKMLFWFW